MPADICGHTHSDRTGERVNFKKLAGWVVLGFILWWVISDPHGAATAVHHAGAFLKHAGTSVATFVSSL